jgi:PKD repeat protein
VANPEGHAASIFMQGSLFNVYHNTFHANFSNCVRAISQGTVPGMSSLFTTWDPTYDGVSRFWGNILDHGRKYPMIEDQMDTIGVSGLPYFQARRSARIWNNTMFRGGTGTGNSPYNVSLYDWYEVAYTRDTVEMHNNVEVGPPMDTTATMCSSQACVAYLTRPSGITAVYDTSGNQFSQLMTFATSGLADSVYFYPALNGILYNNGVSAPAWLTTDFYHQPVPTTGRPAFARNTGVDVGAVQENSGSPSPPSANAGPNQTITLPINSVTLTGSGSETNGTIVSYAWTQAGGPSTATLGSAGQAQTTAGGLVQGTYVFLLTVTDNSGKTASATVTIIVKPAVVVVGLPSANAGSNQTITLPTNSVTLTGSGSESNGTIVSYTWTEVSGPSTATFGTAGQATTTAGGLVAGLYRFQLTITDALGVSASATVQVTVNPAAVVPGAPSANAGADQTITLPTNSVTLTGSGTETNGTIVSYAWTQVSGPSAATISAAGSAVTGISGLVQGIYKFQLTVTDNSGVTATDVVMVTVNPAPVLPGAPSANAGADQTITLPTNSVTLTGSGSETNGTIVSYAWTQVSGPSTAVISAAGSALTGISGLVQGVYKFQLTVTDNSGVTATDVVTVTVNPAVAVPGTPSANAGSDQTITLPTNSVTLTGSGSETNGTIVSYAWTQVSGPSTATLGTAGQATTTAGAMIAGVYRFQLTVTDGSGVTASATVQVIVNAAPVVPGAPSANAGANQTITLPTNSVTLTGSGSETNGTIVSYAWTQVSGPSTATLGTAGQATTTAGALIAGVYRFQLTVTDGSGVTASATVQVIVNAAPVVPGSPSANAGPDQAITLPTNSVTLTGSGTESNGTIVSYAWTQVSGPSTAVISAAGSAQTGISGLIQGVYKFQLTVTDNSGVTATDVAMVTVNPAAVAPPQPPVAIAGPAQTVAAGTVVNLDGSASYDTGGSIVAYDWVQESGFGGVTITNSNTATPNLYGLTPGTYVFQLTVTGSGGGTASATVTITVTAAGTGSGLIPVAIAGNDTTIVYPGQTAVTLNGSGSYETGGSIAAYSWTQVSGPSVSEVVNKSGAITAVSQLVVGDYIFQLTVTDANGDTATAEVKVHVQSDLRHSGYTISLYPNPVSAGQVLNVQLTAASAGQVSITIYDILGHLLKEVDAETSGGTFVQAVPTTGMGRGVYVLLVRFNGQAASQVFKFVVN